jgi:hypothetical protein
MSHYQGSVPEPERAPDWRAAGACKGRGDDMFPGDLEREIAAAKNICRPCPVWRECLDDALRTGDNEHGIRGGLRPAERRAIAKKIGTGEPVTIEPPAPRRIPQPRPTTLAEAFRRRTVADGEHLLWDGIPFLRFAGQRYTAVQAAFITTYGRDPEGPVRRSCGRGCYLGAHLTDTVIREQAAVCGTAAGYRRHKKYGEVSCRPCLGAHSASAKGSAGLVVAS